MKEAPIVTATRMKSTEKATPPDGRAFAIEAAQLAANTHCANVVVLDVRGLSPVTDYFVIATGTSARQMRSVGEEIEEIAESRNNRLINRSVDDHWILLDFVDVVVHIFEQDARLFYDLESLWGDAQRVDWK